MKYLIVFALALLCLPFGDAAQEILGNEIMKEKAFPEKGKISVGQETFVVRYHDNPTSRSLLEQMPFMTKLEDYAGTEKIFQPKKPLNKKDAPKGADPEKGDIMLYAPWGNVAIFYRDFRYADGLVPIGRIEDVSGFVEALEQHGSIARFEL